MGAHGFNRRGSPSAALLFVVALVAGCGSAGTNRKAAAASDRGSADASNMPGMHMGGSNDAVARVPSVNGIKPVASQILATAQWQGMQIQARTTTPTEFVIYAAIAAGVALHKVTPHADVLPGLGGTGAT